MSKGVSEKKNEIIEDSIQVSHDQQVISVPRCTFKSSSGTLLEQKGFELHYFNIKGSIFFIVIKLDDE